MSWFRRKPQEEPVLDDDWTVPQAPLLPPTPDLPMGQPGQDDVVTFLPDDGIRINVGTIADAKLGIKHLRLKKKQFALEKKAVAAEMASIRAERRSAVAHQGSMPRGGGNIGKTFRVVQRISRDADRSRHASRLDPLEQQKAIIESKMLRIDEAVATLEAWIMQAEMNEDVTSTP